MVALPSISRAASIPRSASWAHGDQPGKAVAFGEPGHVMNDRGPARLDPAVVALDRLRGIVGRGMRIVEQQLDALEERLLVTLHGQHVIAATLDDRVV